MTSSTVTTNPTTTTTTTTTSTTSIMWLVLLLVSLMVLREVTADTPPPPIELEYSIQEEVVVGAFVGNIKQDAKLDRRYDAAILQLLKFGFLSPPNANLEVDKDSGVLRTSGELDRDSICPQAERCEVKMDVAVQPVNYFQIIKVTVVIDDKNDNAPQFTEKGLYHRMSESASEGTNLILPSAVDNDSPDFGIQRYELDSPTDKFTLDVRDKVDGSTDVKLILTGELDREEEKEYRMKVIAYDGGNPELSGSVNILISILDANDNDPDFKNSTYEVQIYENLPVDSKIVRVEADDPDEGRNGLVVYGFSSRTEENFGHLFHIDNMTGDITTKTELDYEESKVYHLTVIAQDQGVDSVPADAIVIVKLIDVNDHAPDITVNTLTESGTDIAQIAEDAAMGTFVAHITVVDKDNGENAKFNCSLNDNHFTLAQVYPTEYQIQTAAILDRERQAQYNLALMCRDGGKDPQVSVKHIKVMVADQNDNTPIFAQPSYYASIIENNYQGKSILQVNATDMDTGDNADIRYSLPSEVKGLFNVDSRTGIITAASSIDREEMPEVRFNVIAKDRGKPARSSSALVSINVEDVNDEKPKFSQHSYSFGINENEEPNTQVGVVQAKDLDEYPNNEVSYSIMPSRSDIDSFSINPSSGQIFTTKPLDREEEAVYYLVIVAADSGSQVLTSTVSVSIYVGDRNDNNPVFVFPSRFNNTVHLSNQVPIGYAVTRVRCDDADIGHSARLSYHVTNGNLGGVFSMDPTNGVITTNVLLKEIDSQLYELTVTARDHGVPQRSSQGTLNIYVNKSVPFIVGGDGDALMLSGHNFTIVVSLAVASGIITLVLVIAIVCIRRQDRNRSTHKYNCRAAEALKILSTSQHQQQQQQEKDGRSNGEVRPKKEVSFSLEIDEAGDPIKRPASQQSWPSTIEHNYPPTPQAHSSVLHHPQHSSSAISPPLAGSHARYYVRNNPHDAAAAAAATAASLGRHDSTLGAVPWNLSQKELEVHQLLELLKRDGTNGGGGGDTDSAYSGDGSNTDSGRGPSEEGNTDSNHNGGHRVAGGGEHHHHMDIPGTIPEESFGGNTQVVPDIHHNHSNSYGNSTSTFFDNSGNGGGGGVGEKGMYRTPDVPNPFRKMIENAYGPLTNNAGGSKESLNNHDKGFMSVGQTSPRVKFAEVPTTTAVRYERPMKSVVAHNHGGYHSYMDTTRNDSEMEDDDDDASSAITDATEAQYSCADMTVTIKPKVPTVPAHSRGGGGGGGGSGVSTFSGGGGTGGRVSTGLSNHTGPLHHHHHHHPQHLADDDDATTTTSGSYVVDPDDLCNEIDDLFFKDMVRAAPAPIPPPKNKCSV